MKPNFRKSSTAPRLTAEQAARQGRVSRLAFEALRKPGTAVAFLNGHDEALGGRPIDLAVASAEGLLRVETAIGLLAAA
jgi:hypothetical protein